MASVRELAEQAKQASYRLMLATAEEKNNALKKIAERLLSSTETILAENAKDVEAAKKAGTKAALVDRLALSKERVEAIAKDIEGVIALDGPVGKVIESRKLRNGLRLEKVRVPLGVVGIIYESRPNVTIDASALCIKAGNCIVLRGGSDAINSNRVLVKVLREGLNDAGLSREIVQFVDSTEREKVRELLSLHGLVDVIIPRGSGSLINFVVQNSKVPVIETGEGNCHIYVDKKADLSRAYPIVVNAKTQRPGVCNAAEHLLVHEGIAEKFLPEMVKQLSEKRVEVRGCEKTRKIVSGVKKATDADWGKEYLDLIIGIKVVSSLDEAIAHINRHSTHHSDAILAEDRETSEKFLRGVDSAAVYSNASTRFTDGAQFGMGSEIGISTQKLHARGPMGVNELTSSKFVIRGRGQVRE